MKPTILYAFAVSLLLLMTSWCFAQEEPDVDSPPAEKAKPVKFDEFGDISEREFGPKLARFAEEKTDWGTVRFIVIYNSYKNSPFKRNSYYVSGKKMAYMRYIKQSSRDGTNVLFINGGFLDKWRTELWHSPSDAERDRPPIDKAARANGGREFIGERMFTSPASLDEAKIGGDKHEQDNADEEETEETTPEEGDTDPDEADGASEDTPSPELTFSFEFLKEHTKVRGVLIFYLDETAFDLGMSKQLIKARLDEHIAKFKLDPAWIKIIYGGYRATPELEGWAVPVGGSDPEPMPDEKIDDN